jgi:cardiolipin synthase (CMP-forming)
LNLPNIITLGRLLSVPLAIWLILSGAYWPAFWTFVCAGLSDAADGFIAKRFNMRSEIGALLDPVADKALLASVYVTLGIAGQLPAWLVILVVFRDLLIVGGFVLVQLLVRKIRLQPLVISKINTVLQIVLAGFTLARLGHGGGGDWLGEVLILAVGASTVLSGGAYLVRWTRAIAGSETSP